MWRTAARCSGLREERKSIRRRRWALGVRHWAFGTCTWRSAPGAWHGPLGAGHLGSVLDNRHSRLGTRYSEPELSEEYIGVTYLRERQRPCKRRATRSADP